MSRLLPNLHCRPFLLLASLLFALTTVAQVKAQDIVEEPEDVMCWVTCPRQVTLGKPFTITVRIENCRAAQPFGLRTLSLDHNYMPGFKFNSSLPANDGIWEDTDQYVEFDYNVNVGAGTTVDIILTLTPVKTGTYIGYLDFEEKIPGLRVQDLGPFASRAVQTKVVAP